MKWLIRRDGEVILGMATIGSHIDPNFSVCVNPDAHRVGTCYFKYYNSESYTTADKVVRIGMVRSTGCLTLEKRELYAII